MDFRLTQTQPGPCIIAGFHMDGGNANLNLNKEDPSPAWRKPINFFLIWTGGQDKWRQRNGTNR